MGGVAYIDKRKIEVKALRDFLGDRVPMHLDFGDKSVVYKFSSTRLAEELRDYLTSLMDRE